MERCVHKLCEDEISTVTLFAEAEVVVGGGFGAKGFGRRGAAARRRIGWYWRGWSWVSRWGKGRVKVVVG